MHSIIDRESLVERHRPLARYVASRYRASPEPFDDLLQIAYLGLVKAAGRYDPDRGPAFSTFAVPSILGELQHHFRDRTWAVRAPRSLQELAINVDRATRTLEASLGRQPTVRELAAHLGTEHEAIVEAIEAGRARYADSLDTREGEDERPLAAVADGGFERAENRQLLRSLLATLDQEARQIVVLRFFEDMTQTQIAERIGRSQMHVSRVLNRSLAELQAVAAAHA